MAPSRLPIGLGFPAVGALARPAAAMLVARAAEELGYAAVWVADGDAHLVVATAAHVAGETEQVRIGVRLPLDAVAALPSALVELHRVAPGRLTVAVSVGLGVGGADPHAASPDAADLHAAIVALRARGGGPVGSPEVLLSTWTGTGPDAVGADGWFVDDSTLPALALRRGSIGRLATPDGRAPTVVVMAAVEVGESSSPGRRAFHGAPEQIAADVLEATGMGAREVVLRAAGSSTVDTLLDAVARVADALEAASPTPGPPATGTPATA